jgi:hypothetical protein
MCFQEGDGHAGRARLRHADDRFHSRADSVLTATEGTGLSPLITVK